MKKISTLAAASSVFALTACTQPETQEKVIYEGPHGECGTDQNCVDAGKRVTVDSNGQIGAISGIATYEAD